MAVWYGNMVLQYGTAIWYCNMATWFDYGTIYQLRLGGRVNGVLQYGVAIRNDNMMVLWHCIALHCAVLRCAALRCVVLRGTAMFYDKTRWEFRWHTFVCLARLLMCNFASHL